MATAVDQTEQNILVVDDEEPIRILFRRILSTQGYRVHLAADAQAALDLLRDEQIHAILLDLHMPGSLDGEDLLFLLRDRGDDVPIIVVSGWVDEEMTSDHPDCVQAVLQKPVRAEVLLGELRKALSAPAA